MIEPHDVYIFRHGKRVHTRVWVMMIIIIIVDLLEVEETKRNKSSSGKKSNDDSIDPEGKTTGIGVCVCVFCLLFHLHQPISMISIEID